MPVPEPILRRLAVALGGTPVVETLERLSARDLKSLLLHLLGRRMNGATPQSVLRDHERLPLTSWPKVDARRLRAVEQHALEAAVAFEAIALPPVVPLGATHALGGVSADHVLATIRGVEVLADPIVAFALEAARRRRDAAARPDQALRFCASARVVRMQPLEHPGLFPHFTLFALATATRRSEAEEATFAALREHIAVHLELLGRVRRSGFPLRDVELDLSDTRVTAEQLAKAGIVPETARGAVRAHDFGGSEEWLARHGATLRRGRGLALGPRADLLEREILAPIAHAFPDVRVAFDPGRLEGLGYYDGPCLKVSARVGDRSWPIADGGVLDWTAKLLGDDKEVFVTSGMGLERLVL